MRFFRLLINELYYGGLNKERFDEVKEPIAESNRKSVVSWASIVGLFWFISLFVYSAPEYRECRIVFLTAFSVSVFAALAGVLLIKGCRGF